MSQKSDYKPRQYENQNMEYEIQNILNNIKRREIRTLEDKLADTQTIVNLLKDRLETTEEPLRQLCHIIKVSNYFENIRATQMKQARDIVDINYVP